MERDTKEIKKSKKEKFLTLSQCLILILTGLGGILCISISFNLQGIDFNQPKFYYDFLIALGSSLLIAFIFMLTIEYFSHKRQLEEHKKFEEEIAERPFFAIFKKDLPDEILKEILDHVIRPCFIREDLRVRYYLELFQTDKLKGELFVNYKVRNITNTIKRYTITCIIDRNFLPNQGEPIIFHNPEIIRGGGKSKCIKVRPYTDPFSNTKRFDYSTKEDTELLPLEIIEIKYKIEYVLPLKYQNTWIVTSPTISLTLTISDKDVQLVKGAKPLHQGGEGRFLKNIDNLVTHEWTLKQGILPYQGIQFWWHPRVE